MTVSTSLRNAPQNLLSARRLSLIETTGPEGYALLDCGGGRKLERFGPVIVDRPERQALWQPALSEARWREAHAVFSASNDDDEKGNWRKDKPVPDGWPMDVLGARVTCRLQGLWHLGLFPEQDAHWAWMVERIKAVKGRSARVLNLFGYTGAASLIAAANSAEVTHVDASKKAVTWARENQSVSGLSEKPIRWIVDDAAKFVAREVRRERVYDVILVDPPKFGRGPNKEVWDLFDSLPGLMSNCAKLADPKGASMVLTVYAIRASAVAFEQLVRQHFDRPGSVFDTGELLLRPEGDDGFAVPTSLFVRWHS
ncbi:MAG: class I SAM-dependent methyltransferase [Pseudomonadota bacterium]